MKYLTLAFLLFWTTAGFGQDKPLSNDDRGKLIYYEVVEMKEVSREVLNGRAAEFVRKSAKLLKVTSLSADSILQASGKLIIYKNALVLSRPSGEILYNFYVETKEGKYRFWLTDFGFIPYQRDRYSNFVPSTTVSMPLERKPGKLNAAEWSGYVKATTKEVNAMAFRFKEAMKGQIIVPQAIKSVPVSPKQQW